MFDYQISREKFIVNAVGKKMTDTDYTEVMSSDFDDKPESLSTQYFNICNYTLMTSIPEMLSEWWSYSGKSVAEFLESEELSEVINEKTFVDILVGKYKLTNQLLPLIRAKVPYNVSLNKLYSLNKNFSVEHPKAKLLYVDNEKLHALLRKIYLQKKEKRKTQIKDWQQENKDKIAQVKARYIESHKEEIKKRKKEYRETHREQIKAYKESRREITNRQQRERYHADIESSREKGRMYSKIYKEQNREKVLQSQRKYREGHREEIKIKRQKRMEDAEYREHLRAVKNANYHKNAAKIQQRKTQRRLENLEESLLKEREYGKVYRDKHREEINIRDRERYQANLLENRQKSAERARKYRNKLRFRKETGKVIMPLLDAIINAKTKTH